VYAFIVSVRVNYKSRIPRFFVIADTGKHVSTWHAQRRTYKHAKYLLIMSQGDNLSCLLIRALHEAASPVSLCLTLKLYRYLCAMLLLVGVNVNYSIRSSCSIPRAAYLSSADDSLATSGLYALVLTSTKGVEACME
jgi:hypothetical protein